MSLKDKIDFTKLPKHIAIIMDGNGRWAKQRGKMRIFGHESAVKAVREATEAAAELGIGYLTLYAFSTENWNRPKSEVNALMTLLAKTISEEVKTLNENNIRLLTIGDTRTFGSVCYNKLNEAIESTKNNTRSSLVLALNYGSRWEIVEAVKRIADKVKTGDINPDEIDQKVFSEYLTTANIPDPELLIRTSGEYRVSNFLLWQIAYSELYFTTKLWPDFRKDDLFEAILDYQKRERRFGLTSEQINS